MPKMNKKFILCCISLVALIGIAAVKEKMPVVLCPLKPDPPPVVDGSITEWFTLPGGTEVTEKDIKYGKKKWKNEDDLSGNFKFCWDKNYLYFMAEVVDDKFRYENIGKHMFRNDYVMLDIDPHWEPGVKGTFTNKQFQIGFGAGNMENTGDPLFDVLPEVYVYHPKKLKGEVNIDVAAKKTEDGYVIETRIPWKFLGVKAVQGMTIGVDVHLSDSDDSNDQETMSYLYPHKDSRVRLRRRDKLVPVKLGNTSGK
jgi:Carbohydrate family 9 binding domain-like